MRTTDLVRSATLVAWQTIRPGGISNSAIIRVQMRTDSDLLLTITAESPLRADSADGSTGSLEASLINTPTGTPPSITTGGFMPSTGDMAMYAAAAAAVAGAALIVVALLVKRGGGSHKE